MGSVSIPQCTGHPEQTGWCRAFCQQEDTWAWILPSYRYFITFSLFNFRLHFLNQRLFDSYDFTWKLYLLFHKWKKKTQSIFSNINSKTFVQYKSIYNKNTPPSLLSLPHTNHHKIHSNAPQTLYLRWNYSFVSVKSIRKVKLTPTNCCVAVDRIYWSVKPEVWCRRCFSSMTRFLPDCWRH